MLVMFFAPWCGHCKSLKPKYTEAADQAAGKFVLAKVDCTLETAKELCSSHGVRGYPTLKFFKNGVAQDYTGPRETAGILQWLEKKTGPATVELKDTAAVDAFIEANKAGHAVVGYFSDANSAAYKLFLAAANDPDVEEIKWGHVFGASGRKDGEVELFVHGAGVVHPGADLSDLAKWVFAAHFPLVDEVGGHNFAKYAKLGKPLHLVFIEPTDPRREELIGHLRTVAAEHSDESFSWINAQQYKAQIKGMGASGNVVPCIIRLSSFGAGNKPVVFEQELTLESLKDWAAGVKSGKYKYQAKSEPIPADNSGPVKVVVGNNFAEIVDNPAADVLLEYYAPWCGHCKSLAPKYDELGANFAKVSGVTIAKVDATANDVDSRYEVKGFPTILFYKANDKQNPIAYEGAREVAAMTEFIKKHTTTSWNHDEL